VHVRVWVADGSIDDSRSLRAWLRDEPAVRRYGEMATTADGDSDEMSPGLEIATLVVGSGLSAGQLIASIILWRASHGRPIRVVIERDDRQVPVDTDDPDAAGEIAAELEAG
jgi:hypothetical protein